MKLKRTYFFNYSLSIENGIILAIQFICSTAGEDGACSTDGLAG